ncbi:JAB domain-containing protein [Advenella mimigardefordensis]
MNEAQPLYVRSPRGRYRLATDSQVLAAARIAAESLIACGSQFNAPGRVKAFFQAKLCGLGHECLAVVYLNAQLKVIKYIERSHGTLSQASEYPREIVKTALRLNAAGLIMSHNHPSGIAEPSATDLSLTRHLKQALDLIEVRLIDHIIVAGNTAISLAERAQI